MLFSPEAQNKILDENEENQIPKNSVSQQEDEKSICSTCAFFV